MKYFSVLVLALLTSSCAGMKITKGSPSTTASKPGVSFNGSPVGGFTVQKVGFWCEAKHGAFTFTAFGETEDKARTNATNNCMNTFKGGPCDIASCKHA